ncbi:hypothetical protein T484DRAFT_2893249 [Baffinella frigidus]|nr:hypothetical protein T484DRAFT_2893249 [Cryptophyta sp. CCMP2293]
MCVRDWDHEQQMQCGIAHGQPACFRFDDKLGTWDFLGSNQTAVTLSAKRIQQGQDKQQAAGLSLDKVLDPEAFNKPDNPPGTPTCTAGSFLDLASSRCVACSAGRTSPKGAADASECSCAAGSYYDAPSDLCVVCPEGRNSAAGTTGLAGCLCAVPGVFTNCELNLLLVEHAAHSVYVAEAWNGSALVDLSGNGRHAVSVLPSPATQRLGYASGFRRLLGPPPHSHTVPRTRGGGAAPSNPAALQPCRPHQALPGIGEPPEW